MSTRSTFAHPPSRPVSSQLADAASSTVLRPPFLRASGGRTASDDRLSLDEGSNLGGRDAAGDSWNGEGGSGGLGEAGGRMVQSFSMDGLWDGIMGDSGDATGGIDNGEAAERSNGPAKVNGKGKSRQEEHPFARTSSLLMRMDTSEFDDEEHGSIDLPDQAEPFFRPRAASAASSSKASFRSSLLIQTGVSDSPTPFAKEVRIPTFRTVGQKAGGFVVYECEIKTWQGHALRPWRRYSHFIHLREDLLTELSHLKRCVPVLPPKSGLAKFRPSFLEQRRKKLAFWLTTVLLHPELGASEAARKWVLPSYDATVEVGGGT